MRASKLRELIREIIESEKNIEAMDSILKSKGYLKRTFPI